MDNLKCSLQKEAENIKEQLINIRRDIHSHPEICFNEKRTSTFIAEYLTQLGIEVHTGIGGTGVLGIIKGKYEGKTLMLRADMDCLRINEMNDISYKSQYDGFMHACGHDAHVTWLLGAAYLLNKSKYMLHGNIKLLFQPAEEFGGGAAKCVEGGVLDNPNVDAVIGAHIWPYIESGKIGIKPGALMAGTDFFDLTIYGKGGHGAEPHKCIDPISVGCQIYNSLQTIVSRRVSPFEEVVLTIGKFSAGSQGNVIPDKTEISGTVRTLNSSVQNQIYNMMKAMIDGITKANSAEYDFNYNMYHPPIDNDIVLTSLVEDSAEEILGTNSVVKVKHGSMTGEDFANFQMKVPGVFFWVGTRNESKGINCPLHNPHFNIDEEVLHNTSALLAYTALKFCSE